MANTTPRKKRKKRPYTKKTLLTQDELWKAIVPLLWAPFIRFCMEDWVDKIDFTKKPIFLDKELKRLRLMAKSKNRAVDFLMRLHLKDGTTKTFLLHIEVQGYPDEKFGKRVYQYYYRIGDILDEPVETLVIMIDDDPIFRPNEYRQVFGQTEMTFKFRMFKLLDNPPPYYGKEDNPFSVVFETAWYALKENKLKTDEDLMNVKLDMVTRLRKNNVDTETIFAIWEFINIYLPFADSKKELTFVEEIESFIDNDNDMEALTIRQLYERKIREDGDKLYKLEVRKHQRTESRRQEEAKMRQEEARLRQEAESGLISLAFQLHSQGVSVEKIAEMMTKPVEFVQKLINSAKKGQITEGVL